MQAKDDLDGLMVTIQYFEICIPASEQGQIFEQYFRSNAPHITNYAGLGLSLCVCAETIARHNGSIGIKSVSGKGMNYLFHVRPGNKFNFVSCCIVAAG